MASEKKNKKNNLDVAKKKKKENPNCLRLTNYFGPVLQNGDVHQRSKTEVHHWPLIDADILGRWRSWVCWCVDGQGTNLSSQVNRVHNCIIFHVVYLPVITSMLSYLYLYVISTTTFLYLQQILSTSYVGTHLPTFSCFVGFSLKFHFVPLTGLFSLHITHNCVF